MSLCFECRWYWEDSGTDAAGCRKYMPAKYWNDEMNDCPEFLFAGASLQEDM